VQSKNTFNFFVNAILQLLDYKTPQDCKHVQEKGSAVHTKFLM